MRRSSPLAPFPPVVDRPSPSVVLLRVVVVAALPVAIVGGAARAGRGTLYEGSSALAAATLASHAVRGGGRAPPLLLVLIETGRAGGRSIAPRGAGAAQWKQDRR